MIAWICIKLSRVAIKIVKADISAVMSEFKGKGFE